MKTKMMAAFLLIVIGLGTAGSASAAEWRHRNHCGYRNGGGREHGRHFGGRNYGYGGGHEGGGYGGQHNGGGYNGGHHRY